jgi:hypothetical protein
MKTVLFVMALMYSECLIWFVCTSGFRRDVTVISVYLTLYLIHTHVYPEVHRIP